MGAGAGAGLGAGLGGGGEVAPKDPSCESTLDTILFTSTPFAFPESTDIDIIMPLGKV